MASFCMVTKLNPVSYFVDVMQLVVLKGSTLRDIAGHIGTMLLFGVILNGWAIISYHKRN
ncbi:hypothetical protein [Pedobacter sp. SYSU D00535]|uniref:hypothetical protein n=1 Tax=Pedobacter sp. SYSU D00535 TaxID=2810308 RepID=UPI001A964E85|nr:hypothetical protein [Pedobacter sp. SYSU D00535]